MTNRDKFIEVMNEYFDAGLTKENLRVKSYISGRCSPCGVFRVGACESFKCDKCTEWWDKEWKPKRSEQMSEKILPIPCTKVKEKTTKEWLQKINEELDEFKEAVISELYALDNKVPETDAFHKLCGVMAVKHITEEAADTITAITSMLEAMGIDEEMRQDAQKRVNERNKERGRF